MIPIGFKQDYKSISRFYKGIVLTSGFLATFFWGMYANNLLKTRADRIAKEKYFVAEKSIQDTKPYLEMETLEKLVETSGKEHEQLINYFGEDMVKGYIDVIDKYGYKEGIKLVNTPLSARILALAYMKRNGLDENKVYYSMKEVHEKKPGVDCSEIAEVVAASLADNGFRPLVLVVSTPKRILNFKRRKAHMVFLYKYREGFGFVDNWCMTGPYFKDIKELVGFINEIQESNYTEYSIFDLSRDNPDWIKKIDMDKIPHQRELKKIRSESVLTR